MFFPSRTIAMQIGPFAIHWYGLLYLAAFLLAALLLPRLQHHRGLTFLRQQWSDLLVAAVLGVIVGGRLGYVLLYDPLYFLSRPLETVAVWRGGMSSHGGFVGVTLAIFIATRRHRAQRLSIADTAVVPIALGLMLGRIGNFINQELYGTVTTLPWGIVVPGEEGLRHPTQLYAIVKDLLIAGVCFAHLARTHAHPGSTTGLFLMLYGVLRFLLEFLRVQDFPFVDVGVFVLTRGQLFTIPIFAAGVALWYRCAVQRPPHSRSP